MVKKQEDTKYIGKTLSIKNSITLSILWSNKLSHFYRPDYTETDT